MARISGTSAGGPGIWDGVTSFAAGDVVWVPRSSLSAGESEGGTVYCYFGTEAVSFTVDFFDTPSPPATFSGVGSAGQMSDSVLPFVVPGTAQYVADVTVIQGAVQLHGGSFVQTFASSGTYQMGTVEDAPSRVVRVSPLDGPQAKWAVTIRVLPVALGGPSFNQSFARPGDILTARYATSGDTAISATATGPSGVPVRQLASNLPVGRGDHSLIWDGFSGSGAPLPDGAYTLSIRSSDPSGFTGAAQTSIALDSTAPAVNVLSASKLPAQNAFIAEASDASSGLARAALRVDGRQVASNAARLFYRPKKGWAQGRHEWSLAAVDSVGNRREAGGSFAITPGTITRTCRTAVITPRTGNALSEIRAKGLFCDSARKKLLAWGRAGYRPRRGPRGYRCRAIRRYKAGNGRLRCRAGSKIISFNTGL